MKTTVTPWMLAALIGLGMSDAFCQTFIQPNDKAVRLLQRYRHDYCGSLRDKKPELLQAYYADTIRLMPAFQKTILSKNNALAYHLAFLKRFTIQEVTRNEIEILDLGTQVLETGTLAMRLTLKSNGKEHVLSGKYMNLWQESKDGDLLLITDAWNYDQYYGDIHDQLRFAEIPAIHAALLPNVPVNNSISFELAALNRLLDATVTQHDANTWSLYYTDDSMLLTNFTPVCKGKKAIDNYFQKHVKELSIFEELDIRNDRIDNLGAFVIEYASHIASWKNGDGTGVNFGKNIRIWRREPDHSLKLFRTIGMYD